MSDEKVEKVAVSLTKPTDWPDWIKWIEGVAMRLKLWAHIDPDKEEYDENATPEEKEKMVLPPIKSPTLPQAMQTARDATQPPDASTLQWLTYLGRIYDREVAEYKEYEANCKLLQTLIDSSVKRDCARDAYKILDLHMKIRTIKAKAAYTPEVYELSLLKELDQLRNGPIRQSHDTWLHQWEDFYQRATAANVPDIQQARGLRIFLEIAAKIDPGFATYWSNAMEASQDVTMEKRISLLHKKIQAKGSGLKTALANLQGVKEDGTPADAPSPSASKILKPCFCGLGTHLWEQCPALNPLKRGPDFAYKKEWDEEIERIKKTPRLQGVFKRAMAKIEKMQQQAASKGQKEAQKQQNPIQSDSSPPSAAALLTFPTTLASSDGLNHQLEHCFVLVSI